MERKQYDHKKYTFNASFNSAGAANSLKDLCRNAHRRDFYDEAPDFYGDDGVIADPNGSYTGIASPPYERPVQDADDL